LSWGLCLALLGGVCLAHAAPQQPTGHAGDGPRELAAEQAFKQAVDAQRELIGKENAATPAAAWAGDFYFGDGLGANVALSLAPHAGVAATWAGCLGTYLANKGIVIPQPDGSLQLKYEQANDEKSIGFAVHVLPVVWGERMYLVSEDQLAAFASAVNLGEEPRSVVWGSFLMRKGDEQREAYGLPSLPPAQQRLIHQTPLEVGVVSASPLPRPGNPSFECRYRLELDHGADDGLAAGMELRTTGPQAEDRIKLEQTTANRATGTLSLYGDQCADPALQPSAKTRFTTGAYQAAPPKQPH
jgi:hypothetical protein